MTVGDVEQTAHAFLEQQEHRKSQHKIKGRVIVKAIRATMLELHDIWQVKGKRHSNSNSWHEHQLNLGKFPRK